MNWGTTRLPLLVGMEQVTCPSLGLKLGGISTSPSCLQRHWISSLHLAMRLCWAKIHCSASQSCWVCWKGQRWRRWGCRWWHEWCRRGPLAHGVGPQPVGQIGVGCWGYSWPMQSWRSRWLFLVILGGAAGQPWQAQCWGRRMAGRRGLLMTCGWTGAVAHCCQVRNGRKRLEIHWRGS